ISWRGRSAYPAASTAGSPSSVRTARSADRGSSPCSRRASTASAMEALSASRTSPCAPAGRERAVASMSRAVSVAGMSVLLVGGGIGGSEGADRAGQGAPLGGERVREPLARRRGAVELPRPGLVGVPRTGEELLLLEATQQRVERVGVG